MRYEVIAWDGFSEWKSTERKTRDEARRARFKLRHNWRWNYIRQKLRTGRGARIMTASQQKWPWALVKIWDRTRREFVY